MPDTLGDFQPGVGHWSSRKPIGDPVLGYYPAIVETGLFYRVQETIGKPRTCHGRRGKFTRNLVTGLVKDTRDNCSMNVVDKGKRSSGPILVSAGPRRGSKPQEQPAKPSGKEEDRKEKGQEKISLKCELTTGSLFRGCCSGPSSSRSSGLLPQFAGSPASDKMAKGIAFWEMLLILR
jgi:hypothetical protein